MISSLSRLKTIRYTDLVYALVNTVLYGHFSFHRRDCPGQIAYHLQFDGFVFDTDCPVHLNLKHMALLYVW